MKKFLSKIDFKNFIQFCIGIITILFLLEIYYWAEQNFFSSSPPSYEAIFKTSIIAVLILLSKRIIQVTIFIPYFNRNGHHISSLIKHSVDFIFIFISGFIILHIVFHQNILTLLTASGIIGAILAFTLKNLILDILSGFILDTYHNFKPGDWLFFGRSDIGKVIELNWRTTILQDKHNWIYHIPNGQLIRNGYRVATAFYKEKFELQLPRHFLVDSVESLLKGVTLSLPLNNEKDVSVLAKEFDKDNIIYEITYIVSDFDHKSEAKNELLVQISKILNICDFNSENSILDLKKFLKSIDVFQVLSEAELQILIDSLILHTFKKDEIIVHQAEEGSSMFLIAEGAVKVSIEDTSDSSQNSIDLALLKCGDFFGDIALLTGRPRTASVKALIDSKVYEIEKKNFEPILKNNPQLVKKLTQIIEERLIEKDKALIRSKQKLSYQKNDLLNEIMIFFGLK